MPIQVVRDIRSTTLNFRGGALSIGNFDGVHRGHAVICRRLVELAKNHHGPSIVFSFDPHPVQLLRPDKAPFPLTTMERRAELLEALGIDYLIAYPTTRQLLELDYESFFHQVVRDELSAKAVVEGPNFCFGKNRQGTNEQLNRLCRENQIALEIVQPSLQELDVTQSGPAKLTNESCELVSSTQVRRLISEGCFPEVNQFLTAPYQLSGIVEPGAKRGRELGFPTANIGQIRTLIPANGVYAGYVKIAEKKFAAAIHIGPNLTFAEQLSKVEIHLLDFHGDLYGQTLNVNFVARIRGTTKFNSVRELLDRIHLDVHEVRGLTDSYL